MTTFVDREDKVDPEPQKVQFVKGFHRGIEFFSQYVFQSVDAYVQAERDAWDK